jgi:D-3-phosphoglycerate dehydrogenase
VRVLVADGLEDPPLAWLRERHGVVVAEPNAEDLLVLVPEFDALIVRSRTQVTAEVLARAPRLKVVGRSGVGVDNIDVAEASRRGVLVVNAPTGSTVSVAELTLAHILALVRHLPQADRSVKEGKWEKKRFLGTEVQGKTLGLIGSGRIGLEVATRAQAFGMRVVAYDPYLPPEAAHDRGVDLVDLPRLLETADVVSIHAALTEETRGLIGAKELALMKGNAYLVNCARGGIVDEDALYDHLRRGGLAGAALDVFAKEPPGASPLVTLPNVVCSPHLGASTKEAQERTGLIVVEQVDKALRGERPEFLINPEAWS